LEALLDRGLAESPPDVAHVEHLRGARYALHLKAQPRPFPVVWDSVDCISYLFEQAAAYSRSVRWRVLTGLELDRTRRLEALMRDRMDRTLVTSEIDRRAIEALPVQDRTVTRTHLPVTIVPNGVDLDYFAPGAVAREPDALVFSGKMSYHANVTAALYLLSDIMPRVWQERPAAHLWIVGKDPTPALQSAAERYPGQVTVTGGVPDIRPYLQRATVSVAPIVYGAGIQLKLLEAMASGTPVVAARRATVALSLADGEQVALFDDAAQAAERVIALLSQPEAAARIGAAGRRYVERHHDWDAIAGHLEEIYGESIAGPR
jgi:glycosyltransferase involved in cell wall biosynthesis